MDTLLFHVSVDPGYAPSDPKLVAVLILVHRSEEPRAQNAIHVGGSNLEHDGGGGDLLALEHIIG